MTEEQEDGEDYQTEIAGNLWILGTMEDEIEEEDTWRGYVPEEDSDDYESDDYGSEGDPWY